MEDCWLNENDMNDFITFNMQCEDGDGYTVPKERMERLAELGVIRKIRGSIYEATAFGSYLFESHFGQKMILPLCTIDEINARYAAEHEVKLDSFRGKQTVT